jgi:hypothetical protein
VLRTRPAGFRLGIGRLDAHQALELFAVDLMAS